MKEKSIIKKSYAFQWLIAIIATIFLVVMFLAVLHGQEKKEYVGEGNGIVSQKSTQTDQDSVWIPQSLRLSLFREKYPEPDTVSYRGIKIMPFTPGNLMALLKEYQAYCDTVMIRCWMPCHKVVVSKDSTLIWVADSSLVEYNRNKYRSYIPFPEDFIYWLKNVKLKGKQQ